MGLSHDMKHEAHLNILARVQVDSVAQGEWCCVHPAGGADPMSTSSSGDSLFSTRTVARVSVDHRADM
eukprot:SAG31_NODE_12829_length_913_cov_2.303440_1_plen_68_part_00